MSHPSDEPIPHPELFDNFVNLFSSVSRKERQSITRRVTKEAKPTIHFYILMCLAAVIVTLGLLLDSESIVIGGMLIAPFLPVLNALPVAAVRGSIRLFHRSISTLIVTIFLGVGVAYIISSIVPLSQYTDAVLSRTEPNILYLFVALAAGVVSGLALVWPSLNKIVVGVVVAAALMPPLCVSGIGIANLDWSIFTQSLILFGTNLVAILFTSIVILLIVGFRPYHRSESVELLWANIFWSIILLLLVTIPLGAALNHTAKREDQQLRIKKSITDIMKDSTEVQKIYINKYDDLTQITVQVISARELSLAEWEQLKSGFETLMGGNVSLVINTIPISQRSE